MISTEKAFDMLPVVVDLYDKLNIDEYREEIKGETEGQSKTTAGINLIKYILKNSKLVKEEVFEVVAIFNEQEIEEVRKQSFMLTINTFKAIFMDKETTDFLTQAMQSDIQE